jgi:hypothetical protein
MGTRQYRIIVSGRLGVVGCQAFRDFHIEPHGTDTVLTGDLSRSGLHNALTLVRDLALDLVGFTCLAPEPGAKHQADAVKRREARRSQAAENLASPSAGDVSSVLTVGRLSASDQ